jgi:hypothetical protein
VGELCYCVAALKAAENQKRKDVYQRRKHVPTEVCNFAVDFLRERKSLQNVQM